jgi:hypothetical protein
MNPATTEYDTAGLHTRASLSVGPHVRVMTSSVGMASQLLDTSCEVKVVAVQNYTSRHEDKRGSGLVTPHILSL